MKTRILFMAGVFLFVLCRLNTFAQEVQYDPPWHDSPKASVNFTIKGIDNVPDLYGDVNNPQLVIFFAGNQYMVVEELIKAFKKDYPQYKRVFAETLPPGILARQMKGGSLAMGNMRLTLHPDVYTAGKARIEENKAFFSRTVPYAKNHLAILVRKGNPKHIRSLEDLGKEDVKVSMPNPEWEGIGRLIEKAYIEAGGEELKKQIMETKVASGSTLLTKIHHRQTPLNILYNRSDAGPVWITEARYHKNIHSLGIVKIPLDKNVFATYFAGALKEAPHPEAANDFLNFLEGEKAQQIYRKFGFQAP